MSACLESLLDGARVAECEANDEALRRALDDYLAKQAQSAAPSTPLFTSQPTGASQ